MSKKTLKFDNIRPNKKEFRKSKQPTDLSLVSVDQIVVPNKFKQSNDDFKIFVAYKEGEIVKPLSIILHQMSGYITYFVNGRKNIVKDDFVLDKYNKIWDKIKEKLNIKLHSMLVYDQTYIKVKVKEFDGMVKTTFLGNEIPREKGKYTLRLHCLYNY